MVKYQFVHLGINNDTAEKARQTASVLHDVFGMSLRQGHGYIFAEQLIEIREQHFQGEKGHLAYSVEDLEEALKELKQKGIDADEKTAVYNDRGQLVSIYLKMDVAGFAVHLVRKRKL